MKKIVGIYLISMVVVMTSACGSSPEATVEGNDTGTVTGSTVQGNDMDSKQDEVSGQKGKEGEFSYVDAHGKKHQAVINRRIPLHGYDWDKLVHTKKNISYKDGTYQIRKGVDVSHHQGKIDWAKVKKAGYEFAILRIGYRGYGTSGKLLRDRMFHQNFQQAKKEGLDVGVYLFSQAVNEKEAEEEADLVLRELDGAKLQLPVVYDPEHIENDEARTDGVTGEQFTRNTLVFCEKIKKAGYEPMIYSNMVWEAEIFDLEKLTDYPIWYADYEPVPQTPYQFRFWQYSEKGDVKGIKGDTDLNVEFVYNVNKQDMAVP